MASPYTVWLHDHNDASGASWKPVRVRYGGKVPLLIEVRRTFFGDGHVPMCGADLVGMPREIISHMDGTRFYHMFKVQVQNLTLVSFLHDADLKQVRKTCFLMANHV